ncbi:MAG TPA: tetratricopeptide repeat protein [Candidatus Obscuribacterales bacterium]
MKGRRSIQYDRGARAFGPLLLFVAVAVFSGIAPAAATPTNESIRGKASFDGGEYGEAERHYVRAIDEFGTQRNEGYLDAVTALGTCYYFAGDFPQAAILYKQSIELDEQLHGKDSLRVADDLLNLTRALRRQNLWDEAEPVMQRTLDIRRRVLGEDNKLVAMSWMDLAVNYQRQHKFAESESAFLETIAIRDRLADGGQMATAYCLYAKLLNDMNRPDEALRYRQRAAEINPKFEF